MTLELDTLWRIGRAQDKIDHSIQPLQEQEHTLRNILPTATAVLHDKKEGSHMSLDTLSPAPSEAN